MTSALQTADAITTLDLPPKFDVTKFPREVEEYLAMLDNPFHLAIGRNYFRHLLLEISGHWDQILVPHLTIDEPIYRIGDRGTTIVAIGHEEVLAFYRKTAEDRKNVMGALTMNMCIEDFGVVTEARWAEVATGTTVREHGIDAGPGTHYLILHNIFQLFGYTLDAKLIGERVYDDPASYQYVQLDPVDVVTPEMAREQLIPYLERAVKMHEASPWDASKYVPSP